MGRACSTYRKKKKKNAYRILMGKSEGKGPLRRGGRKILKWVLENHDGIGFFWPGIGKSGEFLCSR
jgi:hypothetical protein